MYRVYCELGLNHKQRTTRLLPREALVIEIDASLPAQRVMRALECLSVWRGLLEAIRCDNGPG